MKTNAIPKIMAFLDLPEIRAANEHLMKTDLSLLTKLVFLPDGEAPKNLDYVHGVYISIKESPLTPSVPPPLMRGTKG